MRTPMYILPLDAFLFLTKIASQGQYVDGLRAPLVLHPPTEVHSYDAEYTIVLGDWYHTEHDVLIKQFISIANPGGAEPVPGLSIRPASITAR
jgi:FtsP/CotA-like multicopper oxidase with cupredoxin domain